MDPLGVCKHHHAAAQKDFARKQCKGFVFCFFFFFHFFPFASSMGADSTISIKYR